MEQRKQYFDIAKGIGIILVIMGHIEYVPLFIRQYIVTFHMPLFFVIGGMLIFVTGESQKPLKTLIIKKLKRIMLPYAVFSVIYPLIGMFYYIYTGYSVGESAKTLIPNLLIGLSGTGMSVLWFLPSLFFGELIVLGFIKLHRKILFEIIFLLALTGIWGLGFICEPMSLFIWRTLFCSLMILAGFLIYPLVERFRSLPYVLLICSVIYFVILYYTGLANDIVDLHFMVLGNKLLYFLNAMLGSTATIFLSVFLEKLAIKPLNSFFTFYGRNSLFVMITHIDFFILYIAEVIAIKAMDYITVLRDFIFNALILILVLLIEALLILLWTKLKGIIGPLCRKKEGKKEAKT